ncbi:helix-turn-helix domain-containing protein [Streptomyces griseoruber]
MCWLNLRGCADRPIAGGHRVPVIAQLVRADEDTVRDVIHRFNEIGLACLDPRWAGDRVPACSPLTTRTAPCARACHPHRPGGLAVPGALPRPGVRWGPARKTAEGLAGRGGVPDVSCGTVRPPPGRSGQVEAVKQRGQ